MEAFWRRPGQRRAMGAAFLSEFADEIRFTRG
jgi:hypothetical protein